VNRRSTNGQTFQEKLAAELAAVGVKLPTITVQYNNLSITANAKKGASISNVANTITSAIPLNRQVRCRVACACPLLPPLPSCTDTLTQQH
jgi:hypothetical protein